MITVSLQFQHNPNPKANLYIQNLSGQTTQKQIYELFSSFGPIVKCKLECYNDGTSRGYCFVQFEKEQDARKAIEGTNGSELDGKKLEVFAHEKRSTK